MKIFGLLLAVCFVGLQATAQENKHIRISTNETDLVLRVGNDGQVYQTYLGEKLTDEQGTASLWGLAAVKPILVLAVVYFLNQHWPSRMPMATVLLFYVMYHLNNK